MLSGLTCSVQDLRTFKLAVQRSFGGQVLKPAGHSLARLLLAGSRMAGSAVSVRYLPFEHPFVSTEID